MTTVARLALPLVEDWQWQQHGACGGLEESRFFHPENERGSERARREAEAKQVCRRCPVVVQCREHALLVGEPYGVWGGLGEGERRAILGQRRRANREVLVED
ncbi:WhiB family transcriptional regulator [Rhodococcus sp. X156]|uniref:WhiB family transcriptional regulator n=1 Tax=Rhodococcus sp. X156 TaxID=2499145 RepID=UPI000FDC4523|nr:WhiB family transcriptional regulator [Rhodococcus sp. X156]